MINEPLKPPHSAYLEQRGVRPDFAADNGFKSVNAEEITALLGVSVAPDLTGLAMVCPATGHVRIRADSGTARYLAPKGRPVPIFGPVGPTPRDPPTYVVTEAATKALAVAQNGYPAIGLGGVSTTLQTKRNGPVLGPSWDLVPNLTASTVVICFDQNRAFNQNVARAEFRLASALETAGVDVRIAELNAHRALSDEGPDDFIVRVGIEAFDYVIESAVPFALAPRLEAKTDIQGILGDLPLMVAILEGGAVSKSLAKEAIRGRKMSSRHLDERLRELQKSGSSSTAPRYVVGAGKMTRIDGHGERVIVEGEIRVIEETTIEDGEHESSRELTIEAIGVDGRRSVKQIAPAAMEKRSWVPEAFGVDILVHCTAAELLTAVLSTGVNAKKTRVIEATGWEVDRDSKRIFVSGTGICPPGLSCRLDQKYAGYGIPYGKAVDPGEAIRLMLQLRNVAPPTVAVLLIFAIVRPLLIQIKYPGFSVALFGTTGSFKTSLLAVALNAYGNFGPAGTTDSFESTENALERTMFLLRSVLVVVDDFLRDATGRRERTANRIIRNVANGQSRGRLHADASARASYPPRGLLAITAEEMPNQEHSNGARIVGALVRRKDVDVAVLTELQQRLRELPNATADLAHWIGTKYDFLKERFADWVADSRSHYRSASHPRLSESVADMAATLRVWTLFALDRSVFDDDAAEEFLYWAEAALSMLAAENSSETSQRDPVDLFLDTLDDLESAQSVALPPRNGGSKNQNAIVGELVGWRDPDGTLYLLKRPSYGAVSTALLRANDSLGVSSAALWKRLRERGILVPSTGPRSTEHQVMIRGKMRKVIKLRAPTTSSAPTSTSQRHALWGNRANTRGEADDA